MVMPRSFSRSIESSTWSTAFLASMVPVSDKRRSARVDLPWSMWATMEKLRINSMVIWLRIPRPCARDASAAVPCSAVGSDLAETRGGPDDRGARAALQAGVGGHGGVALDDRGRAQLGPRAHPDAGADDAVAQNGLCADLDAVPQDGALDRRAHADDASGAQHRVRPHAAAPLEPRAGSDHARGRDGGARGHLHVRTHRAAAIDAPGRRHVGRDLAGEQVQLALPVLGGAADIDPVPIVDPAVERHAVAQ